jgi:hypothetical protein
MNKKLKREVGDAVVKYLKSGGYTKKKMNPGGNTVLLPPNKPKYSLPDIDTSTVPEAPPLMSPNPDRSNPATPKKGGMDALKSVGDLTGIGASIGGPWGAAAGAVAGIAVAGINKVKGDLQHEITQNTRNQNIDMNPYMRDGGEIPEGFEQYDAPSHEMGGQNINPDGTRGDGGIEIEKQENYFDNFVYSDSLRDPYNPEKTFADRAADIVKKYGGRTVIDQDFTKKAAMSLELKKLADLNNLVKGEDEGGNQARRGMNTTDPNNPYGDPPLTTYRYYPKATMPTYSPTPMDTSTVPEVPLISPNPDRNRQSTSTALDGEVYDYASVPKKDFNYYRDLMRETVQRKLGHLPPSKSNGIGLSDPDALLSNAQAIHTGISALQRPDFEAPILPDYGRARAYMDRGNVNFDTAVDETMAGVNAGVQQTRSGVRSTPATQALTANLYSQGAKQVAAIRAQEEAANAQMNMHRGTAEAQMAATDAASLELNREKNQMNRAAASAMGQKFSEFVTRDADRRQMISNLKEVATLTNKQIYEFLSVLAPDIDTKYPQLFSDLNNADTPEKRQAIVKQILERAMIEMKPN